MTSKLSIKFSDRCHRLVLEGSATIMAYFPRGRCANFVRYERIHAMIGFGEYNDKEAVVKAAIKNLFAQHREKIIKEIEAL